MGSSNSRQYVDIKDNPELHNKFLKNVSVLSSHNSYITESQCSSASNSAITKCIESGIRCIELDIFNKDISKGDNEPVVAHGFANPNGDVFMTNKISLNSVMENLNKIAFEKTSDPLFIYLNLNTHENIICNENIYQTITKYFSDKLINGNVLDIPLINLINKVIIISDYINSGNLKNIINIRIAIDFLNFNSSFTGITELTENRLIRIYPAPSISSLLSYNYDSIPFINKGYNFISMNISKNDKNLQNYYNKFNNSRFIIV